MGVVVITGQYDFQVGGQTQFDNNDEFVVKYKPTGANNYIDAPINETLSVVFGSLPNPYFSYFNIVTENVINDTGGGQIKVFIKSDFVDNDAEYRLIV